MSGHTPFSRRDFTAMSIAAGLTAATGARAAAAHEVLDTDVEVKTQDGTCDAAFTHPATGSRNYAATGEDSTAFGSTTNTGFALSGEITTHTTWK